MNYVDWHQSNDEGPLANDGSQAWLAALSTMTAEELTQLADVIDAELAQAPSVGRLLIEDSSANSAAPEMPAWLRRDRREEDASTSDILDEAFLAGQVPALPPPRFLPPTLTRRPAPIPRASMRPEATGRRVYFAFDFDDLARVEAVRQSGKVGLRETIQRGFYDRSVWESRAAKNEAGLLALMREAVRNSSTVCVLSGANSWRSRWVKYEIARAVIEERGLLAIHVNGIEPAHGAPEPAGLSPLHVMGLYQHESGHYYLVERHEVVKDAATGTLGFSWRLYADHSEPVIPPRYVGDIEPGGAAPLSLFTAEHDFLADDGATHIAAWIDAAAAQAGR
jgi:antiphage defense system Thoeris ThsB-like protein